MILPVSTFRQNNIGFKAENYSAAISRTETDAGGAVGDEEDELLENKLSIRARIGMDKLVKAFTIYPAQGLKGSVNSNFYEFLTMGNVPFIIGSVMLMSVFNSATKYFNHNAVVKASKLGNKMALGVFFYAVFKDASKFLTTAPIKWITGIDTEIPYKKVTYNLREYPGDDDKSLTSIEYHKVGESVDFPRWDQLYGNTKKGEARNFRYDKIAEKNGLGKDLNDSDQDVKPMYKEVLVKSKIAKSFSSFLWAVTGVALAFQKPWEGYFNTATLKFWKGKEFVHSLNVLGKTIKESVKDLCIGSPDAVSKIQKHSGKALLGAAVLTTVLGVANTVNLTRKPKTQQSRIDSKKESVVC